MKLIWTFKEYSSRRKLIPIKSNLANIEHKVDLKENKTVLQIKVFIEVDNKF
jgi:hypothetical protein